MSILELNQQVDDIINKSIAGNTYINRDIVGATSALNHLEELVYQGLGLRLVVQLLTPLVDDEIDK